MNGFTVHFSHPWLLMLLIPAAVLTVLPYFFISKRYRRTRNRIVSMILHGIVMVCAIFALAGLTFDYTFHNDENEVLLLVDVSDTTGANQDTRDGFVEQVVRSSTEDGFKIGIVTYGFDQRYTVPLTYDADEAMQQYSLAVANEDLPDRSATDIAAALRYTQTLFQFPESGKILLISDGKQTDENARSVIRSIAAQGIRVDTVNISTAYEGDAVRVTNIGFPPTHVGLNDPFGVNVEIANSVANNSVSVELYDNGVRIGEPLVEENLPVGTKAVSFDLSLAEDGVHEFLAVVKLQGGQDSLENNNEYRAYFDVKIFTRVLILEQGESGQSDLLEQVLAEDAVEYTIDVKDIRQAPDSLEGFCAYDQVILNNISPVDFDDNFISNLNEFVRMGGGLLTTGGSIVNEVGETVAHAYSRRDLKNTLLQQMLPVQAVEYTPPVAVEIIVDISGSMNTALDQVKAGAKDCLNVLSSRDYVGIMTLATYYDNIIPLTSAAQETRIKDAIDTIEISGSTNFVSSIDRAGRALQNLTDVEKRHIVVISDGQYNNGGDPFGIIKKYYNEAGVTFSMIGIGVTTHLENYKQICDVCGGHFYSSSAGEADQFGQILRSDLGAETIPETVTKDSKGEPLECYPTVRDPFSDFVRGITPPESSAGSVEWQFDGKLTGYYGTRTRIGANTVLTGNDGVPIFAWWSVGKGKVGSFTTDVYGEYSAEFMASDMGKTFLRNVVAKLMPMEDVVKGEIELDLREENYFNRLNITTPREEGTTLSGEVEVYNTEQGTWEHKAYLHDENGGSDDVYTTVILSGENNNYGQCNFVIKTPGIYRITVTKHTPGKDDISAVIYKSFSYSAEYVAWEDTEGTEDPTLLLADLAEQGGGQMISVDEPLAAFENLIPELHRTYDPRIILMIVAVVLFLLDIAVRKFKFKWLHEIIRERREKKEEAEQQ